MKAKFKPVPLKINFFKEEERIIDFWKKNKIFEKSVESRPKDNLYSFYDGPPFVTGLPHYGTLLPSIAKDVVPRYQTMKGKRVPRVWGWDCHGLPIENKVEEKLGLKNRREILRFGINKFIDKCREYVETASSEWKWYVDHIGRWVDFDHAYRTMDLQYMETVIWVFKQLYEKGLIYQGNRVSLFCPRCSTPVSNFEIAMDNSYSLMRDPAVTVKFRIKNGQFNGAFILAWTTTPWTLPSNRALVVDPKETYVVIKYNNEKLILAKKRVKSSLGEIRYQKLGEFKGEKLIGLDYEPLYNFIPAKKKEFKIYSFEGMVNMDEGTGVVHSAPGFGEIDTDMGEHYGLTLMFTVDDEGRFTPQVKKWAGMYVKEADKEVIKDLRERNLLFKEEVISHRYPYCYRCETPLIYKAQESWFIDIQRLKEQLLKTNENINWVPGHFKNGRFKKGIEVAPDWCISRTRYWATVMPVWKCQQCRRIKVVGSVKEIEQFSSQKVTDLHRTGVDHLTFRCEKCGGVMKRIPEVVDCWMESGSMPYAQLHYPFDNKEKFEKSFPADYIIEYVAQVRAWFYVMHVVSNALVNSHCFKNVVVTGVIAGTDGRKMSKSYGNYPDPRRTLEKYGGDALRLYFMGSPVMLGRDINITSGREIEEQIRSVLLPFWNSYRYFVTFSNLHRWQSEGKDSSGRNVLDQWIITRLNEFIKNFGGFLDDYRIPPATNLVRGFVADLSKWYIRRSRQRFEDGDKEALASLYQVLVNFSLAVAPLVPFISENIFKNLTGKESVHLEDWPKAGRIDRKILADMVSVREICELGHAKRKELEIRVRQPLSSLKVSSQKKRPDLDLTKLIKDELNVKKLNWVKVKIGETGVEFDTKITPELKEEGEARELIRQIQEARKLAGCHLDEQIEVVAPSWPKKFEGEIKRQTLTICFTSGDKLEIKRRH